MYLRLDLIWKLLKLLTWLVLGWADKMDLGSGIDGFFVTMKGCQRLSTGCQSFVKMQILSSSLFPDDVMY